MKQLRLLLLCLGALLCITFAPAATVIAQDSIIVHYNTSSTSPYVFGDVRLVDSARRTIPLARYNLEITDENGNPVSTTYSPCWVREQYPTAYTISIDVSSSMRSPNIRGTTGRGQTDTIASGLLKMIDLNRSWVLIQSCDNVARISVPWTQNLPQLLSYVHNQTLGNGNDFSIQLLSIPNGAVPLSVTSPPFVLRKVIVLFTDGAWPDITLAERQQVIDFCKNNGITFYTVVIYDVPSTNPAFISNSLQAFADSTNGKYYYSAYTEDSVKALFLKLQEDVFGNTPCQWSFNDMPPCADSVHLVFIIKELGLSTHIAFKNPRVTQASLHDYTFSVGKNTFTTCDSVNLPLHYHYNGLCPNRDSLHIDSIYDINLNTNVPFTINQFGQVVLHLGQYLAGTVDDSIYVYYNSDTVKVSISYIIRPLHNTVLVEGQLSHTDSQWVQHPTDMCQVDSLYIHFTNTGCRTASIGLLRMTGNDVFTTTATLGLQPYQTDSVLFVHVPSLTPATTTFRILEYEANAVDTELLTFQTASSYNTHPLFIPDTVYVTHNSCTPVLDSADIVDTFCLPVQFTIGSTTRTIDANSSITMQLSSVSQNSNYVVPVSWTVDGIVYFTDTVVCVVTIADTYMPIVLSQAPVFDTTNKCFNSSGTIVLTNPNCIAISVDSIVLDNRKFSFNKGLPVIQSKGSAVIPIDFDPQGEDLTETGSAHIFIHGQEFTIPLNVVVIPMHHETSFLVNYTLSVNDSKTELHIKDSLLVRTIHIQFHTDVALDVEGVSVDSGTITNMVLGKNTVDITIEYSDWRLITSTQSILSVTTRFLLEANDSTANITFDLMDVNHDFPYRTECVEDVSMPAPKKLTYNDTCSTRIIRSYMENTGHYSFVMVPNPASNGIEGVFPYDAPMTIYNNAGAQLLVGTTNETVETHNFSSGLYYAVVSYNGFTYISRFIIGR